MPKVASSSNSSVHSRRRLPGPAPSPLTAPLRRYIPTVDVVSYSPISDDGDDSDTDSLRTPLVLSHGDMAKYHPSSPSFSSHAHHSANNHFLYPPTHCSPDPFAAPEKRASFDAFGVASHSQLDFDNSNIWPGSAAPHGPAPKIGSGTAHPQLPPIQLPSLLIQLDDHSSSRSLFGMRDDDDGASLPPPSPAPSSPDVPYSTDGRAYSHHFAAGHALNPYFVQTYALGDELGAGGYGFVMTARHRYEGHEAAVKFIIKSKVPRHAWVEDDLFGKVPTEVMLMSILDHENIVRCLDVFEDDAYFYLVQELHGSPWVNKHRTASAPPPALRLPALQTPSLSPSSTYSGLDSVPPTPPQSFFPSLDNPSPSSSVSGLGWDVARAEPSKIMVPELLLPPTPMIPARPAITRRPSHDLFECIEQSRNKRLSEEHARYIFAQVVEAVWYLEQQGISHRDIKDENVVIDSDLRVKLIDFGSAVISDPHAERPLYKLFYGTTAYASPEILRREPYQAPPAEIWTLGVLLTYLLTGASPFCSENDALEGRITLRAPPTFADGNDPEVGLSTAALDLLTRCLVVNIEDRADINEVRAHPWLHGALHRRPNTSCV